VRAVTAAFLMCVERGRLEAEGLLLVSSLRRWGGTLAEAPVYSFAPRPGHEPADSTVAELAELGVKHTSEPLNAEHPELPNCNKVYACAWAERELDQDVLVFVDSDTVFLQEPSELLLGADWLVASRPVGSRNAGSRGEGDRNESNWQRLYEAVGATARPWVETVIERERIRAYFNTGLIAARREAGVYGAWRDALDGLLDSGFRLKKMRGQTDQMLFAAVVTDLHERVKILPDTYNYPLPKRIKMRTEMQALELDDLVHVHLHRWAHKPGFLDEVHPPLDTGSERYRWLAKRLPLEPLLDEPFRFPAPRAARD
jgi:hypothetical protein